MRPALLARSAGFVLLLGVLALAGLWVVPADAAGHTVRLVDDETGNRFDPSSLTVVAGDTITWKWAAANHSPHSVRVDAIAGPALEGAENPHYDSHPGCAADTPDGCGAPGTTRSWSPTLAGTYTYSCRLHPVTMRGTLTVDPAPSPTAPTETGTADPQPDDATETASPSPTGTSSKEDPDDGSTGGGSKDRDGEPRSTSDGSGSSDGGSRTGTADDPGITYGPPTSFDPGPLPTVLPSVAPSQSASGEVEDPDLEAFPSAPQPSASSNEPGIVAIDAPRGPSPRAVWLGIGSASILVSAGAFVKLVLFGAPWA